MANMQNEPTLQQLRINLSKMGAVIATGDATRRALVRAKMIDNARTDMLAQQDTELRKPS